MRFDLHVHTALSACAENIMSPGQVVRRAAANGIGMLAVTDHNASLHVRTAMRAAANLDIVIVPGVEVSSREEVHLLALFDDIAALDDLQLLIDQALPDAANLPEVFGQQVVFDENDEVVDIDERLRQVGANLSLERLVTEIHSRNGLAVPAHVFRARNSLWSQLGVVDAGTGFDLLEIAYPRWIRENRRLGDVLDGIPLITGSDAHFIEDVGRVGNELAGNADNLAKLVRML